MSAGHCAGSFPLLETTKTIQVYERRRPQIVDAGRISSRSSSLDTVCCECFDGCSPGRIPASLIWMKLASADSLTLGYSVGLVSDPELCSMLKDAANPQSGSEADGGSVHFKAFKGEALDRRKVQAWWGRSYFEKGQLFRKNRSIQYSGTTFTSITARTYSLSSSNS